MSERRVLVVGASGIVGRAAFAHFAGLDGWEAIGLSRRAPDLDVGRHVSVDLMDAAACRSALADLPRITHVVYAALFEKPGLVAGWFDPEQMETNRTMLRNLLEAVEATDALEHVSLLQGTKAYGAHVGRMRVPGREREARHDHDNFYWLQEDLLRERAEAKGYAFTIWRPPVVYGHAFGAPMNPLAPLVTFAAVEKHEGQPLSWPGGATGAVDAIDANLLARALAWGAQTPTAAGETYNVANGDVLLWRNAFERIADAVGMELGAPEPRRLAEYMPTKASIWDDVVAKHGLRAPSLEAFVGDSFIYTDIHLGFGLEHPAPPNALSTIKLRHAGFVDCVDSEDSIAEWVEWMQSERLIPPR